MQTLAEVKKKMEAALTHLGEEYKQIRTGRSHPGLVENIMVTAYGSQTPLKGLASISTPDPKSILVSPWDKSVVKDIEKALQSSQLGITPSVVGTDIRLVIPDLTQERRDELTKVVHTKAEEARVSLRTIREEYMHSVKADVDSKAVSEDELARAKKEIQTVIDGMNKKIEELADAKIEQITTV